MDLLQVMMNRRSVRKYTGEPVPEEKLERILQAGLVSASGRRMKPWEFIVVKDKDKLCSLSKCREHGPSMIAGADCAIVVAADEEKTDVWTEDCSIAMANMHLMADSLGVGSCWVQVRLREAPDGRSAEEYIRELLAIPEKYKVEAILSLGIPAEHPEPHTAEELLKEKVHREKF